MKITKLFVFFCIYFFSTSIFAQTIAIINIQSLIDNNLQFITIFEKISNSQKDYLKKFEIKEMELNKLLNDIENSKLILSENEINLQIDEYNKQIQDFTKLVDDFNIHYENQLINIKETIFREIIIILEKYATDNKIDLVLDSTSYLIASNSLDITDNIKKELEKLNLQLEYINFETN